MCHVTLDGVMKELRIRMGRMGLKFSEGRREWRFPGLLCANDLALCRKLEEDLRLKIGSIV